MFLSWYVSIKNLIEISTTVIQASFIDCLGYHITSSGMENIAIVGNNFFFKKKLLVNMINLNFWDIVKTNPITLISLRFAFL